MARTLSRREGCGNPRARWRLRSVATSSTVSISSRVHSRRLIRSRPRRFVCIVMPSLGRAEDERQERHPEGDAVEGFGPVALVSGPVDIGGGGGAPGGRGGGGGGGRGPFSGAGA